MGEFKNTEPYDKYKYHIAIENYQSNYYFSEKILNPLYRNSVPIYLGCINVEKYLPNMSIRLTGVIENDMKTLRELYEKSDQNVKNIDIEDIQKRTTIKNIVNDFLNAV